VERYLTPSEVAEIFGISRSGVIKWIRVGKIKAVEVNGRWRIPYSEIERLLSGGGSVKQVAIYARVSSNTQKDDLERQLNALREWVRKSRSEILNYVYKKYPEYGKYTMIRDKVLSKPRE